MGPVNQNLKVRLMADFIRSSRSKHVLQEQFLQQEQ